NFRGFAKASRRRWLNGWWRRRGNPIPDMILGQETNHHTTEEKEEIRKQWKRAWQLEKTKNPLSHWQLSQTPFSGMGILVSPTISDRVKPWNQASWTEMIMAVEMDEWLIINVYAPAKKKEQPHYFKDLEQWLTQHDTIILGGDFNCVLRPSRDRITKRIPSTAACESLPLKHLMNKYDMTDGVELHHDLEEEDEKIEALRYFTRWIKDGASRLDRFYVKGDAFQATQAVQVTDAAHDSDHQEKNGPKTIGALLQEIKGGNKSTQNNKKRNISRQQQTSQTGAARSFGVRLKGRDDETRRFFKRNSEWQRDQSITDI
ncbi:hypothetical protein GN958_ATG03182, partial [Phytophthora infestans]